MGAIQRVVKPTTRLGKKILRAREPQVVEGPKQTLFFHGRRTSETTRRVLKDWYVFKKPDAQRYTKKNDITVFENVVPVEALCKRAQAALFVLGSHSKKRPNNVVLGRLYNNSLLDMYELGIEHYQKLAQKMAYGSKPIMIFNGPAWESKPEYASLKSLLTDLFHRESVEQISLQGLEHAISFTITSDGYLLFRSYQVLLKKSGLKVPRIELEEIGPRIDFSFRRCKLASPDLMKEACQKPKVLQVRKKKNVSTDGLGTTHGNVHVGRQNLDSLVVRKKKLRALQPTAEENASKKRKSIVVINNEPTDKPIKKLKLDAYSYS